jgi:hypothetical protein
MTMNLTVQLPDALAARFASPQDMQRRVLEALALDEFRLGRLTRPELKTVLGFETRGALDAFLLRHGQAGLYRPADLDRDRADLQRLGL